MRYFVQIMAGCGIASFLVGFAIKFLDLQPMMNAGAIGWWRASVLFMAIGILYALIEIRDLLRATKA